MGKKAWASFRLLSLLWQKSRGKGCVLISHPREAQEGNALLTRYSVCSVWSTD